MTAKPNTEGSALVLGGVNPSYYTGDFKYYPLKLAAWWVLSLDKVALGDNSYEANGCIVDSGTSLIVGNENVVGPILR